MRLRGHTRRISSQLNVLQQPNQPMPTKKKTNNGDKACPDPSRVGWEMYVGLYGCRALGQPDVYAQCVCLLNMVPIEWIRDKLCRLQRIFGIGIDWLHNKWESIIFLMQIYIYIIIKFGWLISMPSKSVLRKKYMVQTVFKNIWTRQKKVRIFYAQQFN